MFPFLAWAYGYKRVYSIAVDLLAGTVFASSFVLELLSLCCPEQECIPCSMVLSIGKLSTTTTGFGAVRRVAKLFVIRGRRCCSSCILLCRIGTDGI